METVLKIGAARVTRPAPNGHPSCSRRRPETRVMRGWQAALLRQWGKRKSDTRNRWTNRHECSPEDDQVVVRGRSRVRVTTHHKLPFLLTSMDGMGAWPRSEIAATCVGVITVVRTDLTATRPPGNRRTFAPALAVTVRVCCGANSNSCNGFLPGPAGFSIDSPCDRRL